MPTGTKLYRVPRDITAPTAQTGSGWSYSNGTITIAPGGVLTNVQFTGVVVLSGANETVKRSDLTDSGTDSYTIQLRNAPSATVVANSIHGTGTAAPGGCDSAVRDIYGNSDNLTVKNNDVWYCADPMNNIADGGLIEQNYFHDFGSSASDNHFEDIQLEPGDRNVMTIHNNTFLNPNSQTAAIILSNDAPPPDIETKRVIDHNLLAGGGYCFYGAGGSSTPSTNIRFRNNSFSPLYYPKCGYYGTHAYWTSGKGNVWSGNIWDNNGTSVAP